MPDDLMPEDPRQCRRPEPSFDFVQLGVADAAGGDADQYVSSGGIGTRNFARGQRARVLDKAAELLEDHRAHPDAPASSS
ncbi:MAG TPA: hypothetical protein VES67_26295 [Vicinamibacterales bacterium]|nr:hypothetical protein [Vicinamibacterales bacterium]